MDIKNTLKTIMQAAGKNSVKTAEFLGISKQAMSIFLNTDFNQIKRFIKICNFCGLDVVVTDHKNFSITLTSDTNESSETAKNE